MRRSRKEIQLQQPENQLMQLTPQEAQSFTPFYNVEMSAEFNPPREALRDYHRHNPRA
jgi:hypothetical protein